MSDDASPAAFRQPDRPEPESVDGALRDPGRLAVLRRTMLLDAPAQEAFDRLSRLATIALGVPVSLISLVDADRQVFTGAAGLPEPWASARQTPLTHSFCKHVVATRAPLVVEDARLTPLVADNLAIADLGIIAYAGTPLITADGYVLGALCAVDTAPRAWTERDLTILADLALLAVREIELRARETTLAQHARLLDEAYDAIFVWNWDGPIVYWNRGAERLYGYPADQAIGRVSHDLLCTAHPRATPEFLRELERDGIWEGRLRHNHRDGRTLTVESRQVLLREPTGWVVLEINRDVTERVRAEEDRTVMLGTLAHDVKNPLGAIKGYAQLLRRQLRKSAPNLERLESGLDGIESAADRATALLDAMLDAARLEAGRPLDLHPTPTDLVELARQAAAETRRTTTAHQVRVESNVEVLVGEWDRLRLQRVLANLLSNAVKYSPDGGEIVVRVARVETGSAVWAELSVIDRGLGIPAADLPGLFQRFRRGHNVGSIGGAGIGLVGTRQIVAQHGGTLEVETEEGRGSTFTARLPLTRIES
ncbi:MAG: PAS domain S-box protein [Thermomicrobiales bacterium]|nr:PAS domain S-box protein [Thermomicrobiales bacterium]